MSRTLWDCVRPFLNLKAFLFALLLFVPMSCLGLSFVAIESMSQGGWSTPMVIGLLICWPNALLYWLFPHWYVSATTPGTMLLFYAVQFGYVYMLCLLMARWFRRV